VASKLAVQHKRKTTRQGGFLLVVAEGEAGFEPRLTFGFRREWVKRAKTIEYRFRLLRHENKEESSKE